MDLLSEVVPKLELMDICSEKEEEEEEEMGGFRDFNRLEEVVRSFRNALCKRDYAAAEGFKSELNVLLPAFSCLVEQPPMKKLNEEQLRQMTLLRSVHEHAVMCCDVYNPCVFETVFAPLKPFYKDPWDFLLPPSDLKHCILHIYLVGLVEKGRMDDFHMEVESLSAADLADRDIESAIMMQKLVSGEVKASSWTEMCEIYWKTLDRPKQGRKEKTIWTIRRGVLSVVDDPIKAAACGLYFTEH